MHGIELRDRRRRPSGGRGTVRENFCRPAEYPKPGLSAAARGPRRHGLQRRVRRPRAPAQEPAAREHCAGLQWPSGPAARRFRTPERHTTSAALRQDRSSSRSTAARQSPRPPGRTSVESFTRAGTSFQPCLALRAIDAVGIGRYIRGGNLSLAVRTHAYSHKPPPGSDCLP